MSSYSWTIPASPANVAVGSLQQDEQAKLLGKDVLFNGDYAVTAAGDYVLVEGLTALRAAVYRRLLTRPGEYKARPEYGVGIMDFVKRRNVPTTLAEIRQRVTDQLSLDPRISEVREVVVEAFPDGIKLGIVIQASGKTLTFQPFDFRETQTIGTLGVPEGTGLRIGEG